MNQLSICTGVLGALVAGLPLRFVQAGSPSHATAPFAAFFIQSRCAACVVTAETFLMRARQRLSESSRVWCPPQPRSSDPSLWRACFAFALVPAVLHSLLAAVYAPETPQWLIRQARTSLCYQLSRFQFHTCRWVHGIQPLFAAGPCRSQEVLTCIFCARTLLRCAHLTMLYAGAQG